jgi:hypothetical protein
VDTHAQANDLILIEGYGSHEKLFNYYTERTDTEVRTTQSVISGEAIVPDLLVYDRVWDIRPPVSKPNQHLVLEESAFEGTHSPIDYESYKQIDLVLYEKK